MLIDRASPNRYTRRRGALLAATRIFSGLGPDLVGQIGELCSFHEFPPDTQIFSQGDDGDVMYIIVRGLVHVYVTAESGEKMVLTQLRPFESFGELALLDGQPRSASVRTVDATVLMALDRMALLGLLRTNNEMMEAVLRSLGSTVRRLTEQSSDLVFLDLHERVSKLLLGLVDTSAGEGTHADLSLSATLAELATAVGGTEEAVNEILRSFEQFGYVEIDDDKLIVRDAERLFSAVNDGMSWADLAKQAFRDPLTQLANRIHFDERLHTAVARAQVSNQMVAVMQIDLDDFKGINDSLGHKAGDELLTLTAERLRSCIRQPDTAARLGGDEFALLLAEVDTRESAEKVAQRVVAALAAPATIAGREVHPSASVGLAVAAPDDDITAADLLQHADVAMYMAKRSGKHGYSVHNASVTKRDAGA